GRIEHSKLQDQLRPELDAIAGTELGRQGLEESSVDDGSVRRPQILDDHGATANDDTAVLTADAFVHQAQVGAARAADNELQAGTERHDLPGADARHDGEVR